MTASNTTHEPRPHVRRVLYETGPGHRRFTNGTILPLDADGHKLLMAMTVFADEVHDYSASTVRFFCSADAGFTWSDFDQGEVFTRPDLGTTRAPSLLRAANGDILNFFHIVRDAESDAGPWARRSLDNGDSWGEPERLPYEGEGGTSGDHPKVLSTGRIIVPCCVSLDGHLSNYAYCMVSDDDGHSWRKSRYQTTSRSLPDNVEAPEAENEIERQHLIGHKLRIHAAEEPAVVERRDGSLLMFVRCYAGSIYRALSRDGGDSWSEFESSGIPAPGAQPSLKQMPNGDILLLFNRARPEEIDGGFPRNRLGSAVSQDDGVTWEHIRNIDGGSDFPGKITMANVTFVENRAVVTYSRSETRKNHYSWWLQILPLEWFYAGPNEEIYSRPLN